MSQKISEDEYNKQGEYYQKINKLANYVNKYLHDPDLTNQEYVKEILEKAGW